MVSFAAPLHRDECVAQLGDAERPSGSNNEQWGWRVNVYVLVANGQPEAVFAELGKAERQKLAIASRGGGALLDIRCVPFYGPTEDNGPRLGRTDYSKKGG